MTKVKATDVTPCMVCNLHVRLFVGPERVPLCGIHVNQLRKKTQEYPWSGIPPLSRREIRSVFGFLMLDDSSDKRLTP